MNFVSVTIYSSTLTATFNLEVKLFDIMHEFSVNLLIVRAALFFEILLLFVSTGNIDVARDDGCLEPIAPVRIGSSPGDRLIAE